MRIKERLLCDQGYFEVLSGKPQSSVDDFDLKKKKNRPGKQVIGLVSYLYPILLIFTDQNRFLSVKRWRGGSLDVFHN